MLELIVKIININPSAQHPILQESRSLYEYSYFIQKIKDYLETGKVRDEAITLAMNTCITEGIMEDFIQSHGSEVRNMLFTEFNLEDAMEVWGEERYEDGQIDGIRNGARALIETFKELGLSKDETFQKLVEKLEISPDICQEFIQSYWEKE